MGALWHAMGFTRWPLTISLVAVLVLTLYASARLFRSGARADLRTRAFVDAILFWGGFALAWGVLGTLIGITIAAQAIEAAGNISTSLVWGGIKVALLTSEFGMLILVVAALVWFGLQFRWRMLEARELSRA
jgi:hypothetical protein